MMKALPTVRPRAWSSWLIIPGLILLMILPRLTALNRYLIVDEADRWRWAEDFTYALTRGDWAGTRVGDGYPGIVPVWAESLWVLLEAGRRSVVEGGWIGEPGLYLLFHEWDRPAFLDQQRLPIVLLNTGLALAIVGAVWRLFGRKVALVAGLLIALDPFYLSDSRVNRAEAVITGLMTLSVLALVFYERDRRWRYVVLSGFLGGLSFLTKIQALALLPVVAMVGLWLHRARLWPLSRENALAGWGRVAAFGLAWAAAAGLTWLALWPAMWVIPGETLALVYDYATHKVGAEGVNLFFWGQTYENADPGAIFYPFVFLMRITPLALLGLLALLGRAAMNSLAPRRRPAGKEVPQEPGAGSPGSVILLLFVLGYALMMTLGSHKQDRYLLPIFAGLDILAALGLVYLGDALLRLARPRLPAWAGSWGWLGGLLLVQAATVLPHHPYYYSYFNPLLGGGRTAVQTMRIGWGEGMDQVGAYLAAKPNSRELVVSSRFTHNMLGFKGQLISLTPGGRWTQADYVVLYIQQVQRRQEPSPAFIDYFLARPAEKVITLGGIDYAWIYPIPFTTPANPEVSRMDGQAALLGYSWEARKRVSEEASQRGSESAGERGGEWGAGGRTVIRVLWENLGLAEGRQLVARLVGSRAETGWVPCQPDPAFTAQARTPGAYVESLCVPAVAGLPAGFYTVEFGLAAGTGNGPLEKVDSFLFPEGWQAARLAPSGDITDTPEVERLAALADQAIPAAARRLDRVYGGRLRLAAYQLEPAQPRPGDKLTVTLYWQLVQELPRPLSLVVQLADSRLIALGRSQTQLAADRWFPGQVVPTRHEFEISPDLVGPLAGRLEVTLHDEAEVALPVTNGAGTAQDVVAARLTVAPTRWPDPGTVAGQSGWRATAASWQDGINLAGSILPPGPLRPGETLAVDLYWTAARPVEGNYAVFVHLVDEAGRIRAQNDDLPVAGAYPTPWWEPGRVVEDRHGLALPPDLPPGEYSLLVGLYRPEDGARLALTAGPDSLRLGVVQVQE